MATIYADIVGVSILRENPEMGTGGLALVAFNMGAYTGSSDSGSIGAGGTLHGVSQSSSLATILQNMRRDGKTVTIRGACRAESGSDGTTSYYAGTLAVSSGSLTFNVANAAGTEIDAASGFSVRPCVVCVAYDLS